MADSLGTAVLELSTDNSKLNKGLDQGEKAAKDWTSKVGKTLKDLAIGAGLVIGVKELGKALAGAFQAIVGSAIEASAIQVDLAATIRSTGGAAGMTVESLNDLAAALSRVTLFEDDTIAKGESMLLTFTNIGRGVFPQATEAMLDMAQKMGGDLQGAAIQLGKALNDPVAGLSALTRVGVTFSDKQKEQIKQMVDWGNVAGAQKLILKELAKEFGGVARAAGENEPWKILANDIGNVGEEIGTQLLPVLKDLTRQYGPELVSLAKEVGPLLGDLGPIIRDIAKAFVIALQSAIGFVGLMKEIISYGNQVVDAMNKVKSAINTSLGLPQSIQLPGFAGGVRNFAGGMALVGERGPELTYLQPHSNVLPAQQTAKALGGDTYSFDLRGSPLTEAQVYRQFERAWQSKSQGAETRQRMR